MLFYGEQRFTAPLGEMLMPTVEVKERDILCRYHPSQEDTVHKLIRQFGAEWVNEPQKLRGIVYRTLMIPVDNAAEFQARCYLEGVDALF